MCGRSSDTPDRSRIPPLTVEVVVVPGFSALCRVKQKRRLSNDAGRPEGELGASRGVQRNNRFAQDASRTDIMCA